MPSPVRENGKFPYYAFPGGYTIIYIAGDNEVLCPECANLPEAYSTAEKREAIKKGLDREDGPPDYTDRAWELVAVDTYDEGLPIQCAHCNKDIESSYGPTDADYRDMIRDWHHQITKRDPSAGVLEDILQYVKDEEENEGGPNDMRGNYHSVGVFVREFIDNDAKSHEKPVGRRQSNTQQIDRAIHTLQMLDEHYMSKSDALKIIRAAKLSKQYVYRLGAWICPVCHRTHYPEQDKITPPTKCDTCGTHLDPPTMKAVGRKQPSDTKNIIEVWIYDVWGNEEDGYEVNDRSKISEYETDLTELSDKDIKEIIEECFFHPETISSDGNGDDQHIYLVLNDKEHSDYPLGEIYLDRG